MAHKNTDYKPEDIRFPEQKIVTSELVHEMTSSYIEYAMSVIVGRALPDVRDGLKPVHRRILNAMNEDGLTNDKPFKKSATCVGDVLGRYHPHGDASFYDAMVRLAQDFSMRYMLVDGHGNFGSVDGDPPAAYRYTEARLSKISNEMLRDIEKDTVDWDPNFDEPLMQPALLPSSFQAPKATTATIKITAMMSMMLNFPTRFAFCSMISSVTGLARFFLGRHFAFSIV